MGRHRRRRHPFPSLHFIRFTFSSHPILFPPPQTIPLPFLRFPSLTLLLHLRPFLLPFFVPLLTLNEPDPLVLFLLFTIKGLAFGIVSPCTECTGHLVQLSFFGGGNGVRVG